MRCVFWNNHSLTEERRVRPLTSLHQALILSLSTPGSNFTSTPCIPSSLSLSLQGSFSSLSRYFITSSPPSVTISLFHTPHSISSPPNVLLLSVLNLLLFFLFYLFTLFISLLSLSLFLPPQIISFFFFFFCEAAVMERWREGGSEQKVSEKKERGSKRQAEMEKVKYRCGKDFRLLISIVRSSFPLHIS